MNYKAKGKERVTFTFYKGTLNVCADKVLIMASEFAKAAQLTARHKIFPLVTAAKAGLRSTINLIYAKAVFFGKLLELEVSKKPPLRRRFFMNYSAAVASVVSVLSQFPQ